MAIMTPKKCTTGAELRLVVLLLVCALTAINGRALLSCSLIDGSSCASDLANGITRESNNVANVGRPTEVNPVPTAPPHESSSTTPSHKTSTTGSSSSNNEGSSGGLPANCHGNVNSENCNNDRIAYADQAADCPAGQKLCCDTGVGLQAYNGAFKDGHAICNSHKCGHC